MEVLNEVVSCGQVSSITFLLYEICITFDEEVNSIWSKPRHSWIKWQFIFIRYFALIAQITNRTIESAVISDVNSLAARPLKAWFVCQVFIGYVLMVAVEVMLMARVFALYRRSLWVGLAFVALIFGETVAVLTGVLLTLPDQSYNIGNLLARNPDSFIYFGSAAAVSQFTIIALTLAKYKSALQDGWGKTPIVSLLIRDGTAAFFILFITSTLTVLGTIKHNEYAPIGNSWFLSIVSSAGCRLIINMEHLSIPGDKGESSSDCSSTTVQLTTVQLTTVHPDNV